MSPPHVAYVKQCHRLLSSPALLMSPSHGAYVKRCHHLGYPALDWIWVPSRSSWVYLTQLAVKVKGKGGAGKLSPFVATPMLRH
ncbi:hypothetical protein AAC387_Pa01g2079 [Persea americana]